ncbi:siphovirus ReqiPepy6 Gp37-like family protein [Phenylobacterium sp. J367]|uniref:siphovirus ReqiPepy6 Gp37-like family protein n=1 Tax=Phenylobacterium sp. J367 TaxID=2898435 RepID=UPI00215143A8|nr:siphovirus ReqiPepy6 Gp37-like family protein [Phenylobacterium sp. J367]MCR5879201.1 siphovirus ReqiPepy6 Gp37-like family protein [Phenylobacterium sp. J367]
MSQHLHLRGFTGRPAAIGAHLSAHAVNPASQPVLSRIPMLTLAESYARGEGYQYLAAFQRACADVLGEALARTVVADLLTLQETGLDRLSDERKVRLVERYAAFDHPAAREVVDWLQGGYAITGEALQTQ